MNATAWQPAEQIAALIAQLTPPPGTQLVLAYSGGVDSEVLAYGLAQFAKQYPEYRYLLVHVHHGLSGNADRWATHCQGRALAYGLPIKVKQVAVNTGPRVSLEAAARDARYHALAQELTAGDLLLTAHHQDDQLETLLLALKRGLGPKGLAAMGAIQAFHQDKWLLRPLLDISRQQVEQFAATHAIEHIEDESNLDNRFDRNFLRLEVIPALRARWPAIAATSARSAQLCAEQQALIDDEVASRLPAMLQDTANSSRPVLDLRLLAQQSAPWRAQLLRGFIDSLGFAMPSAAQLKQVLVQLIDAKEDAKVEIRLNAMVLRRFRHQLYIDRYQPNKKFAPINIRFSDAPLQHWLITDTVSLQAKRCFHGARLRLPMADEQVSVRFGAPGSLRCHPHFRDKGRELKKLWQELAVPPWMRDQVPLIYFDDNLVAAVGYWIEKRDIAMADDVGVVFELQA